MPCTPVASNISDFCFLKIGTTTVKQTSGYITAAKFAKVIIYTNGSVTPWLITIQ